MITVYDRDPLLPKGKVVTKVHSITISTNEGQIILVPNEHSNISLTTSTNWSNHPMDKKREFEIEGDYNHIVVIE